MMDLRVSAAPCADAARCVARPQAGKAFDVLPLGDGDTAAAGHPIGWYQDWLAHEDLTDDYWTQQSHTASVPDVSAPVVHGHRLVRHLPALAAADLRPARCGRPAAAADRRPVGTRGAAGGPSRRRVRRVPQGALRRRARQPRAPVRAFLTGAGQWHDLPALATARHHGAAWHLHASGLLDPAAPDGGVTRYAYDPGDPTPAVGGPSLTPDRRTGRQRRARTPQRRRRLPQRPLEDAVVIAGEPVARIRFRSSAPSADVFVRICDVHPDGRSMTVCDGIRRIGSVGAGRDRPAARRRRLRRGRGAAVAGLPPVRGRPPHRRPGQLGRTSALRPQPRHRRTRRAPRPPSGRTGDLPRRRPALADRPAGVGLRCAVLVVAEPRNSATGRDPAPRGSCRGTGSVACRPSVPVSDPGF